MEDQLEQISQTVLNLQSLVKKSGVFADKPKGKDSSSNFNPGAAVSETTIYHNLINQMEVEGEHQADDEITFNFKNRGSTSSEDRQVNMSDEFMNIDCDKFIAECEAIARSKEGPDDKDVEGENPFSHGETITKNAVKDQILAPRGKNFRCHEFLGEHRKGVSDSVGDKKVIECIDQLASTSLEVLCDQEYMAIGGNIDGSLQEKIINFENVDFAKLIPRDKIAKVDDHRMELVVKGGSTYFAPVAERESTTVNSFTRWEQAFRIYSNLITCAHPGKASELIQYNHMIYTASLTFVWNNVYNYDHEFHIHISNFPQRSWGVILQQAWAMCLKDRIKSQQFDGKTNSSLNMIKIKEPCRRYNKGKCSYGRNFRFEHRCDVPKCGKFGHGAHICKMRNGNNLGNSGNREDN